MCAIKEEAYMEKELKEYNFISLGHFCGVASELKRYGLRNCSSPFDWCISPWEAVECCIDNQFEGFLDYASMEQSRERHQCYKNKYGIEFYHDFDRYKSLKRQLDKVEKKYTRRIKRFYKNIEKPTMFFRYVMCDDEMRYFEENYDIIRKKLKGYNPKNIIVLIANSDVGSLNLPVYYVEKDDDDTVAREFGRKNAELNRCLKEFALKRADSGKRRILKKPIYCRVKDRIIQQLQIRFLREYIHNIQYDD